MDAIRDMDIGQVVDYVEEYNRIHNTNTKTKTSSKPQQEEIKRRKATQADWDWFLG